MKILFVPNKTVVKHVSVYVEHKGGTLQRYDGLLVC